MNKRSPSVALLLLAATIAIPRLFSRSLIVLYDPLFWQSQGNGYAPTAIALVAKLVAAGLVIAGLAGLLVDRRARAAWVLIMITSGLVFVSISRPERNLSTVTSQGSKLVSQIEAFHDQYGRYPSQLNELSNVPHTGLAKQRRFYYASDKSKQNDKGPWFYGAKRYLGKASYVICVPLVPGGTLVYRSDGDYSDLPGYSEPDGWFHTTTD